MTGKLEVQPGMDALETRRYRSYLLRIWQAHSDHETWRASLERVGSDEWRNFASLPALFEYLIETTQNSPEAEEGSVDGEDRKVEP
jgi:hypothetical protein